MLQEKYEQQRLLAEQADMQLQYERERREQQQREIRDLRDVLCSEKRDKDDIRDEFRRLKEKNKQKIFVEMNIESKTSDVQQLGESTNKPRYYDAPRNASKKNVVKQLDRCD